ncbi:MAG: myo-inosose-2 dehydratase [Halomonas sp.]|nr:myo-inosose-2 dehydratase [Halomonas sp.]|tara:strand:- start:761 stop:1660 length:900 start_codon:yes stop_codon:yes gene_type:complete
MSIRLGINPLTWTNDDLPSLGGDTPLETCLAEGREAGFDGFELGHKFPRDAATLGPILERHQLSLVSGWYSAELLTRSAEEEIAALTPHLELLKALGARVMVFCEVSRCVHGQMGVPLSHRPTMSDEEWTLFTERLDQVAEHCQREGVQIAYHHHLGTLVESEADIDRLMASTGPALGLLLDTGHLVAAGGDPFGVLERHAARVNHVHCKDIRAEVLADVRNRNRSFLEGVLDGMFTVPGDGFIDYGRLFQGLVAHDYQGWVVVEAEQDPAVAHPLTYARKGYDHLARCCDEAGLALAS